MAKSQKDKKSRFTLPDLDDPDYLMTLEEAARFFNAFGYTIDKIYLYRERSFHPDDFQTDRTYGGNVNYQLNMGQAIKLINSRHGWIQKWRGQDESEMTPLWIAERCQTNPVAVMRVLQKTETITKYNQKTGAYYVLEPDLETIQSMLPSLPESQLDSLPAENAAGCDSGTEGENPADEDQEQSPEVTESTDDQPPLDNYDPTEKEDPNEEVSDADYPFYDTDKAKELGTFTLSTRTIEHLVGLAQIIVWTAEYAVMNGLDLETEVCRNVILGFIPDETGQGD